VLKTNNEKLPDVSKKVLSHFSKAEIRLIKATFKDLAMRSPGNTIDRNTFLKHFPLPGLHGEQLFDIFDYKNTGVLDYGEFITGFALCCKGSPEEKSDLIFRIYDITKDGNVSKSELKTMLYQVPGKALEALSGTGKQQQEVEVVENDKGIKNGDKKKDKGKDNSIEKENLSVKTSTSTATATPETAIAKQIEEKGKVIDKIIEEAFEKCDLDRSGKLSFEQFKLWVTRKPQVMELLDSAFDFMHQPPPSPVVAGNQVPASPTKIFGMLSPGIPRRRNSGINILGLEREASTPQDNSGSNSFGPDSVNSQDGTTPGIDISALSKEGWLAKKGRRFQRLQNRLYKLQGNIMFYFGSKNSTTPKGVILLTGCFVDPIATQMTGPESNLFGFKIVTGVGGVRDSRIFYAKTEEERDSWVEILRSAGRDRKFISGYIWKEKIGTGKFSNVYKCERRSNGEAFAVKVIKKKHISEEENELLRTEIAILRLVAHRNIVKLIDVFETLEHIYIVMELLEGGELYHHIVGRSRFCEYEAYILLSQLADGLDYLHSAGVVHRDLKPENILLKNKTKQGSRLDSSFEIKLSDFGLSKLVAPNEIMKLPCGTISYVAPEVLSLKGYGIEADLWSMGVIMYLVLRGKLPFNSEEKEDIIEEILHDDLEWEKDRIWSQVSLKLVDLISGLLHKDPSKRLTAAQVKQHPWMIEMKEAHSLDATDAENTPIKLQVKVNNIPNPPSHNSENKSSPLGTTDGENTPIKLLVEVSNIPNPPSRDSEKQSSPSGAPLTKDNAQADAVDKPEVNEEK